ncbi:uncharacterized protein BT62DRAFT_151891 [Guyanagaster necrorhizus]|uniref:Uncharacterized protein n=1 Tax=Guyanagaster necrorhizus TaxID=856835 RepID=A0A9P7VRH5_9AGAR|nr:uncharacterized protein BT62DRAFT_151891 [Guyanagaster necrorhizus MCA 3950]KAG7446083.1 hypothetical protein BT62DRAFT_151891 [Guyanagaster necrorhizus MCA 3950]
MYPGTARRMRQTYDKRPWSLVIVFFLLNVILAASPSFISGRIVNILTSVSHQRVEYQEITVEGDLSENDASNTTALVTVFNQASQLLPNGSGLRTLTQNMTTPTRSTYSTSAATDPSSTNAIDLGSLLRYPRWSIRIHCEKIPDGSKNMSSNGFTYLFTPRETMEGLFSSFNLIFFSDLEESVADVLQLNDTLPSTVDVNGTALAATIVLLNEP